MPAGSRRSGRQDAGAPPARVACLLLVLTLAWSAGAATIHNDASCDIAVAPAATLLLPWFEVDLDDPQGEVTIFTITNVTNVERIARVTLWTGFAVPVLTFNVALTGYDVQSINLYDVLARGITPDRQPVRGPFSKRNRGLDATCAAQGPLSQELLGILRTAFTEGRLPSCDTAGDVHENAAGYATIDVVGNCALNAPDTPEYWAGDVRWENVLVGDYQQVHPAQHFARGSPLVHIRAVPEGGTAAQRAGVDVPFPRTFYGIYQSATAPKRDARQPLPMTFATRWIEGGRNGFETWLKIWRQGERHTTCARQDETGVPRYLEMTRFDEAENAESDITFCRMLCVPDGRSLASSSRTRFADTEIYRRMTNGAVAGWLYLNLDHSATDTAASQNWIVASLRAEGRYSIDFDAVPLGNGCSAPVGESEIRTGTAIIGPRP